jgi:hypothetical protein
MPLLGLMHAAWMAGGAEGGGVRSSTCDEDEHAVAASIETSRPSLIGKLVAFL